MVMENSSEKSYNIEIKDSSCTGGKSAQKKRLIKKRPKKQPRPKKKVTKNFTNKQRGNRKIKTADDDGIPSDEEEDVVEDGRKIEDDNDDAEELDVKRPIPVVPIETKIKRFLQKELSLSEKMRLIKEHRDHKKSLRILASEFNIGKSTVSGILKRREMIQKEHDSVHNASDRCRKQRHTETKLINDLVWKWYQITKSKDTPLSGPKIKTKARDYANDLGYDKFKASNGWLDTFKKTHGIRLPVLKIYGAVRELRNGGQRTLRSKSIENKKKQRSAGSVEPQHSSEWDTGTQNSAASLHIPQIFEPEVLLQTSAHQSVYLNQPQHHQQHQQQQQHHHHHHHHNHHHQQQQQPPPPPPQSHPITQTQTPQSTATQQILATQWPNNFQQIPSSQPQAQNQPQQQQQHQQQSQHTPGSSNSQTSSASNDSQQGSDHTPQQMMNNLSGMYNYAMSKNDHTLANQVLHLKATFEASIISDRYASNRRQPNNGSYFW